MKVDTESGKMCLNFDVSFANDIMHFCLQLNHYFVDFDYDYNKRVILNHCGGFNSVTGCYNAVETTSYKRSFETNGGLPGHGNIYIEPYYNYITNIVSVSLKSYEGLDKKIEYMIDGYDMIRIDEDDDISSYAELVLKSLYGIMKSARY